MTSVSLLFLLEEQLLKPVIVYFGPLLFFFWQLAINVSFFP